MSQKPTCLYREKNKNFVIVETKRDEIHPEYELLMQPLSNKDALDICLQEDFTLAKMMLEMQLHNKLGLEENISGKEKNILNALKKDEQKAVRTAFTLIKNLSLNSPKTKQEEYPDDTEHLEFVKTVHQSLLKNI